MPSPDQSPAFHTIAPSDTGARLAHLQDLIADAAGRRREGLITDYHEAVAAGAMHSTDDSGVILVTLITRDNQSHVYALPRHIAQHLREQLIALRTGVEYLAARMAKMNGARAPVRKPGGHLL